jgi:hypothetical protein
LVVLAGAVALAALSSAPVGAATDCTRNGCVDQDQLTDEQGGVLSRFMGVK